MAGDVRGHDLESWWKNRVAYRDDATTSADQWRMASEDFSHASGGAPAAVSKETGSATSNLIEFGQSLLIRLNALKQRFGVLDAERQQVRSNFSQEENAIGAECRKRVQAEREEAIRRARETAERLEKGKVLTRKVVATVIFVVIAYVLVEY
jgi:hypothetical protein